MITKSLLDYYGVVYFSYWYLTSLLVPCRLKKIKHEDTDEEIHGEQGGEDVPPEVTSSKRVSFDAEAAAAAAAAATQKSADDKDDDTADDVTGTSDDVSESRSETSEKSKKATLLSLSRVRHFVTKKVKKKKSKKDK